MSHQIKDVSVIIRSVFIPPLLGFSAPLIMVLKDVSVLPEPLDTLLSYQLVSNKANATHACRQEEVSQLALILVVGAEGLVPALQAAEEGPCAGGAGQGGLQGLETCSTVLSHVFWQGVADYWLLN